MARSHGRILTRIWQDPDFRAASAGAQRLYMLMLSQPDLGHAGVLALTARRWAGLCADTTPDQVEVALQELHERRFIIIDWDTEEVLIRTLIRNDAVYKMPQLWHPVVAEIRGIMSVQVRAAVVAELERLPLGLDDRVETAIQSLTGGVREPLAEPVPEGVAEGSPDPSPNPSCARARKSPTPTPSPETPHGVSSRARARGPTPNGKRMTVAEQNAEVLSKPPDLSRFGLA